MDEIVELQRIGLQIEELKFRASVITIQNGSGTFVPSCRGIPRIPERAGTVGLAMAVERCSSRHHPYVLVNQASAPDRQT